MASDFPTREDVALWDKYDATYGMDAAGALMPGAKSPVMPMSKMQLNEVLFDIAREGTDKEDALREMQSDIERIPMNESRRRDMMRNYIASRKSGIASLGFDPSKTVLTTDEENLLPGTQTLGFSIGDYSYSKRDPRSSGSTPTHEGMHLGIDQLIAYKGQQAKNLQQKADAFAQSVGKSPTRKETRTLENMRAEALKAQNELSQLQRVNTGAGDQSFYNNEITTRALMQKHFGNIEREGEVKSSAAQVEAGKNLLHEDPEFLDMLEQMAADELKRRGRPMGPR